MRLINNHSIYDIYDSCSLLSPSLFFSLPLLIYKSNTYVYIRSRNVLYPTYNNFLTHHKWNILIRGKIYDTYIEQSCQSCI